MNTKIFAMSALISFSLSCGSISIDTPPSSATSVSEVAVSSASGTVQSTESAGSIAWLETGSPKSFQLFDSLFSPAYASGSCSDSLSSGSCSGNEISLRYGTCKRGTANAYWNGTEYLTFSGGATCSTNPTSNTSGTLKRHFSDGTYRIAPDGEIVTMNTNTASGWETSKSGGTVITFGSGVRDMAINGIHYVATANYKGKDGSGKSATLWDETVSTDTSIHVVGTGNTRTITSGTIRTQHNLKKYTGVTTITSTLGFSAGCCVPTSGSVSTTLSGTKSGTETLSFSAPCGTASLTNSAGGVSSVTLQHCL